MDAILMHCRPLLTASPSTSLLQASRLATVRPYGWESWLPSSASWNLGPRREAFAAQCRCGAACYVQSKEEGGAVEEGRRCQKWRGEKSILPCVQRRKHAACAKSSDRRGLERGRR
uniref:Uncharacterized protein n=1 Tax=Arundo donax TaxID=35708 RepID=A0A0A9CEL9_ARUDO